MFVIHSHQIGELKPATSYVFLVRAENVHGLSVPSPLSAVVKTSGVENGNVPQTELAAARIVLSGKVSLPEPRNVNRSKKYGSTAGCSRQAYLLVHVVRTDEATRSHACCH